MTITILQNVTITAYKYNLQSVRPAANIKWSALQLIILFWIHLYIFKQLLLRVLLQLARNNDDCR